MGIVNFVTGLMDEAIETTFIENLDKLVNSGDPQTSVFTNVRRIDDVFISAYAIDEALADDSPVWLLSDQGKIFLSKIADEREIIPPVPGDYIAIRDFNARRTDVETEHFSYTRDPKTISNDVFAYFFDAEKNILVCSVNADAVDTFKTIFKGRKEKILPELARTAIEISRGSVFFLIREWNFDFGDYGVYIDGVKVDSIGNGESKFLAVTAGQHELKLKNFFGLEKSEPLTFEISENQHLKFSCKYIPKAFIPCVFLFPNIKAIELTKMN